MSNTNLDDVDCASTEQRFLLMVLERLERLEDSIKALAGRDVDPLSTIRLQDEQWTLATQIKHRVAKGESWCYADNRPSQGTLDKLREIGATVYEIEDVPVPHVSATCEKTFHYKIALDDQVPCTQKKINKIN